ncbi:MAG: ATP-binding protein [Alphaproteobacteria bacterium]
MKIDADDALTVVEALDATSDAVVIYDADGRLVACNANFKALYGYSDDEARPGVHFRDLGALDVGRGNVVVGDERGGADYLERKAEYRRRLEGSFVVRLADGRWIRTTDRRTRAGGFVSIQTDITELKSTERALRVAKEAAEAASRTKTEFLASMSHELRTPLNAIIGFASVLEQELYGRHATPKYREYAHDIVAAGQHLMQLIDDILDVAKIENSTIKLAEEAIDLAELNAWCTHLFDDLTLRSGIVLTATLPAGAVALNGDAQRVRQIVVNLVSNAIRFTPPGGTVAISWTVEDGGIVLTVTDTGSGIDPAFLPHVFEPFRQGEPRAGTRNEGTGLGLALVKRFAELHGGGVTLDSAPGRGTTVRVRFPPERTLRQARRARA